MLCYYSFWIACRIYVDAVFNHMTGEWSNAQGTGGSYADTGSKYYPSVPYSSEHFHSSCDINNYNDASNVRNCELSGLKDLDQVSMPLRQSPAQYSCELKHLTAVFN